MVARDAIGGWPRPGKDLGGGQSAFVLTVPDEHRQVAMFDLWCPTNAVDGRYVWREIEFEDGRPVIKWEVK